MIKFFPLHRDWLFAIVVSLACILLAVVDLANVPKAPRGEHARARVVDVDNSNVRVNLIVKTNAQVLTVELLDGARRGERMTVTNMLMGNMEMDEFYETGAVILVEFNEAEGKIVHAMARGHYRLRLQIVVMDLAMDIAATMDEIKRAKPQVSLREHIASGLRVGRAVVGTMTTTLLLAYSGTHVAMFLLFMSKGLPPQNIFNSTFIAAEVLNILVGSFGVVAVAPFTALAAGIVYRNAN